MAKRITSEMQKEINELYCQLGIKSAVAKELGISASSVTKYLIDDYVPEDKRIIKKFCGEIKGCLDFANKLLESDNVVDEFCRSLLLTDEERDEMSIMQREEITI